MPAYRKDFSTIQNDQLQEYLLESGLLGDPVIRAFNSHNDVPAAGRVLA
jgi:hypothetical protein